MQATEGDPGYAVLFVDDEPQARKYFQRAFAKDFNVLTAPSVAEARRILEEEGERVGVLVSDQRMPGELGVELLSEVRQRRPGIVRILTTAYSDLDSAIEAVNDGAIYRYVTKPWDIRDLRGVLLRAMEFFNVQRERDQLLREKLGVLQRMVVLDRVRSFTVLAASLGNRMRNSMMALKAFLELAPVGAADRLNDPAVQWTDLWTLAQQESQRIMDGIEQMLQTTFADEAPRVAELSVVEILEQELRERRDSASMAVRTEWPEAVNSIRGDESMIRRLVRILLGRMDELTRVGGTVVVSAEPVDSVGGVPGVRVGLLSEDVGWNREALASLFAALQANDAEGLQAGMDVLGAFFIAYHHAGDLRVHPAPPRGPGFELLLPCDPEAARTPRLETDWLERIFTNLEPWE